MGIRYHFLLGRMGKLFCLNDIPKMDMHNPTCGNELYSKAIEIYTDIHIERYTVYISQRKYFYFKMTQ